MEKTQYRVLVSNTLPLFNLIKELGFKEKESRGHGINQTRQFKKGNKHIHSNHYKVTLFQTDPKTKEKTIHHNSLTIHDEILKFFANRNPIQIKNGNL